MKKGPNHRAGVDAGFAALLAFARPCPGTTQHGRWATMRHSAAIILLMLYSPNPSLPMRKKADRITPASAGWRNLFRYRSLRPRPGVAEFVARLAQ